MKGNWDVSLSLFIIMCGIAVITKYQVRDQYQESQRKERRTKVLQLLLAYDMIDINGSK